MRVADVERSEDNARAQVYFLIRGVRLMGPTPSKPVDCFPKLPLVQNSTDGETSSSLWIVRWDAEAERGDSTA